MFTKQHYEAIAATLNVSRVRIRKDVSLSDSERSAALMALNDTVLGFVWLFKRDNPKFKDLVFIGACACADASAESGQE